MPRTSKMPVQAAAATTALTQGPTHTQLGATDFPQGVFRATRTSGISPLAITFNASYSAPDNLSDNEWFYNTEFIWNFGDPGQGNYIYGGLGTDTNVSDAVWGSPTGDTVTITSAGANLPAIAAGSHFRVRNHVVSTTVADAVWGAPSGETVTITSAGANLPTITAGGTFRVTNHSNSANNGEYIEVGGSPTASSVTARKRTNSPQAAASESVDILIESNNGFYQESGGSPTTSSVTATKIDGTPVSASAQAVDLQTALGEDKNSAFGPVAAHVFEVTEGGGDQSFTVTLTMRLRDGTIFSQSQSITAYDPQGANGYPGAQTVVISSSLTEAAISGEPPGARKIGTDSTPRAGNLWSTIEAELEGSDNSPKRVLLQRGDTWTNATSLVFFPPGGQHTSRSLGAFGTGAKPIVEANDPAFALFSVAASDVRIQDIDFRDVGPYALRLVSDDNRALMSNFLLLRCDTTDFGEVLIAEIGEDVRSNFSSGKYNGPIYLVEHQSRYKTQPSDRLGRYLIACDDSAFLGCSFQGHEPLHTNTIISDPYSVFNMRFAHVRDTVIANCRWFGFDNHRNAQFRIHANKWNNGNTAYRHIYTERTVTTGCEIDADIGGPGLTISTVNPPEQRFRLLLVERNWFHNKTGASQECLKLRLYNNTVEDAEFDTIHVRSNVFTPLETPSSGTVRVIRNTSGNYRGLPRGIRFYNNSVYTSDTDSSWDVVVVTDVPNEPNTVTIRSNLAVADNIATIEMLDDNTNLPGTIDYVAAENPEGESAVPSNWFVSATPEVPANLQLAASSPAIDVARVVNNPRYQFDGLPLNETDTTFDGVEDCGAWEESL